MMLADSIPGHVPAERLVDFDVDQPLLIEQDYFSAWKALKADTPTMAL